MGINAGSRALTDLREFLDYMYSCAYILLMDVEWDIHKAESNVKKHRVDFVDAASPLHDELAITVPDDPGDKERFVTIGMDAFGRLLVVV